MLRSTHESSLGVSKESLKEATPRFLSISSDRTHHFAVYKETHPYSTGAFHPMAGPRLAKATGGRDDARAQSFVPPNY